MNFELVIQYVIIIAILLIIALVIVKLNHKDFNMDVNKLVKCLGGKDNILDSETTMSRFKVTLKDVSLADKDGLSKLGAQGIVEIDNQLKIILGPNSKQLKRYIKEIKK
ncbi:MAG: PTS transporter subunit EIIB [Bacilli bacterium]|nr:PTS transporter subunit EIIB [Bacilli bacterium]